MHKWTIKEALQIMFPRPSKSLENSIAYKFFKKVHGLSWEEYNKLLDSYYEKTNPIPSTDVDDSHCQCTNI